MTAHTIELVRDSGRFVDLSPTHRKHARRYSWLRERLTARRAAAYVPRHRLGSMGVAFRYMVRQILGAA